MDAQHFEFKLFVPGIARTAGSKSGFINPNTGKVIMAPAGKYQKPWMDKVGWMFMQKYAKPMLLGPIKLECVFWMKRPDSDYRIKKGILSSEIKPGRSIRHIKRPDCSKLVRAVEDALTHCCWKDDSQVCEQIACKIYVTEDHPAPGAEIIISTIEELQNE